MNILFDCLHSYKIFILKVFIFLKYMFIKICFKAYTFINITDCCLKYQNFSQTSIKSPKLWGIFWPLKPIVILYLGHREIP